MKQKLASGTTLVVDRYAFSGVAFSSAKVHCSWLAPCCLLPCWFLAHTWLALMTKSGVGNGMVQIARCGAARAGPAGAF